MGRLALMWGVVDGRPRRTAPPRCADLAPCGTTRAGSAPLVVHGGAEHAQHSCGRGSRVGGWAGWVPPCGTSEAPSLYHPRPTPTPLHPHIPTHPHHTPTPPHHHTTTHTLPTYHAATLPRCHATNASTGLTLGVRSVNTRTSRLATPLLAQKSACSEGHIEAAPHGHETTGSATRGRRRRTTHVAEGGAALALQ